MKKLLCAIFVLLLTGILPLGVLASSVQAEGTCGEGLTWVLQDHTLTISGSGDMEDGCPWEEYKDEIRSVVLTGGVSRIGAKAFYQFEKLKDIDFGDSLREIGPEAFYDCNRIERLVLPATFRSFEAKCFQDCDNLSLVYCYGPMPHFRDSCFWTVGHIDLYYPLNNPWPSEYVSPLLSSYGSHRPFMGPTRTFWTRCRPSAPQLPMTRKPRPRKHPPCPPPLPRSLPLFPPQSPPRRLPSHPRKHPPHLLPRRPPCPPPRLPPKRLRFPPRKPPPGRPSRPSGSGTPAATAGLAFSLS